MNFYNKYKTTVLSIVFTVLIGGALPTALWVHNAYADDRYVQTTEMLRAAIKQIDHSLFEIDQEISFADNEVEKRKFVARKSYYDREKKELESKLKSKEETK